MSRLFLREAEVIVAGRSIKSPPLSIDFQIPLDTDPEPNLAKIKIYNLSDDTMNRIRKGLPLILNAGYQDDVGTVFAGIIEESRGGWEIVSQQGSDRVLDLIVGEATDRWLNTFVNKSYKTGIKGSQIISDLLKTFGLEIGAFKLPRDVTYSKGRTLSTSLQAALRSVAGDCGAKLHISNGAVFIRPQNEGTRVAFVLNSNTGLIDAPQRLETDDEREWLVTSLFNHRIRADSILKVESRNLDGFCRVVKCEHTWSDAEAETRMEVAVA